MKKLILHHKYYAYSVASSGESLLVLSEQIQYFFYIAAIYSSNSNGKKSIHIRGASQWLTAVTVLRSQFIAVRNINFYSTFLKVHLNFF